MNMCCYWNIIHCGVFAVIPPRCWSLSYDSTPHRDLTSPFQLCHHISSCKKNKIKKYFTSFSSESDLNLTFVSTPHWSKQPATLVFILSGTCLVWCNEQWVDHAHLRDWILWPRQLGSSSVKLRDIKSQACRWSCRKRNLFFGLVEPQVHSGGGAWKTLYTVKLWHLRWCTAGPRSQNVLVKMLLIRILS